MRKILRTEFIDVDDELIEVGKLFNVYLFGLPRSGTSMTTHILELLGVNMVYTSEEEKEKTDERFRNKYGEYHANPNGFFEITKNQFTSFCKILSTPYSGCKMIIPVTGYRWEVVKEYPSKVIMMERDLEEVRQSQEAYYAKEGSVDIAYLRTALATQKVALREHKIDHMIVNYNELLRDKVRIITQIRDFIKSDRDIQEAVDFVSPKQNRFRAEELVSGL